MDLNRGRLCFVLFLPLSFSSSKVILEKHIGTDVDLTPLCTDDLIVSIHCNIKKEVNGDVLCSLMYIPGQINETRCSSRVSLMTQNHTVFLRLMDLTPVDSGAYDCECTAGRGIWAVQVNVFVEENEQVTLKFSESNSNSNSNMNWILLSSVVIASVVIIGVIVGCLYRRMCCRKLSEPAMTEEEGMETYAALQHPTNDLYQTIHTFK